MHTEKAQFTHLINVFPLSRKQDVDLDLRKTLLIEEIPRYLCKKGELKEYFAKAFDGRQGIPSS